MDKNEKKRATNPRQGANLLSIIFFKWLVKTFITGYKRELEESDLHSPLDEHSSDFLGKKISQLWEKEEERCRKLNVKSTPSLLKVIVKCFGLDIMLLGILTAILELGIRTTRPLIFAGLLRHLEEETQVGRSQAMYWASALLAGFVLDCIIHHSACQGLAHVGMKARLACSSLLYRKILQVPQLSSKGEAGQMIDCLSNEAYRLDKSVLVFHYTWITPIQTVVVSYLLYEEINLAAVGGIFFFSLLAPIFACYGKWVSQLTFELARKTNERLRLTNEIINGIKVVKMYAWEKPFSELIDKTRAKEIKTIRNRSIITQVYFSLEKFVPRLSLFGTLLIYILYRNDISVEKVYLALAYYNVLGVVLYRMFPMSIKNLTEALTTINRIRKFLLLEEIQPSSLTSHRNADWKLPANIAVSLENVSAAWHPKSKLDALKEVSLAIRAGRLVAIVGRAGAGKSSLLRAILGELGRVSGKIKVNGRVSYAGQESWLLASTIRQNILLGRPMDARRYERVLGACQLRRDLELLAQGDESPVGARAVSLSPGQRARLSLARALYREADVYLLDEPLAAVEPQLGRAIFRDCLRTLLRGKTVLLASRHCPSDADELVVLEDGALRQPTSHAELPGLEIPLARGTPDEELVEEDEAEEELRPFTEEEQERLESRRLGGVTARTYLRYLGAAGSPGLVLLVLAAGLLAQVLASVADWLLARWLEDGAWPDVSFVWAYGFGCGLIVAFVLGQACGFYELCRRISRSLHARVFGSVACTAMDFFGGNHAGRIMNRFSKDVGTIDTRIPQSLIDVMQFGMYIVAFTVIVVSINLWFIIPVAFTFLILYYLRSFYMKTNRSVRRLEGITRSRVLNHLSASVEGLTTIRALSADKMLTNEFDKHQDLHSSAWFSLLSGSRALGFYAELFFAAFTAVVVYSLLLPDQRVSASFAGLAISQCTLMAGLLQWAVRQWAELEGDMISVERLLDYARLPSEAEGEATGEPPGGWPVEGRLAFEEVSLTYERRDRPSLKKLSFGAEAGEKIGIVGGPGSGKSSILSALLRLAGSVEGRVSVDDLPTREIDLAALRSRIAVVAQETLLFSGTLRWNLDPQGERADRDLWQALEDVGLKAEVAGLDAQVAEAGGNFSAAQRQLLCLARAIVRNSRILVLDGATDNVDARTNELVREIVRRRFADCTVLLISHHFNTLVECSKILVIDAGEAVEFDHPFNLLQRKNGAFYNMVHQIDGSMATNLFEVAKFNYETEIVKL